MWAFFFYSAYEVETAEGKADLIFGRIGRIIEDAEKQQAWQNAIQRLGGIERIETRSKGSIGRGLLKRRKERNGAIEEIESESIARRRERQKNR